MNIIHIDLTGPYSEGMGYHDNILPKYNALDGHNVTFIATKQRRINGIIMEIKENEPTDYILTDGVRVIRMPYVKCGNKFLTEKIRLVSGINAIFETIKPDIIFVHGLQTLTLLNIIYYKKEHSYVKLYVDNHSDINNSATNIISKYLLHKVFYRAIIQKCLPFIDKVFYLSYECGEFLRLMYNVLDEKMEFYPLGGTIFSKEEHQNRREKMRKRLELNNDHIVFAHSGKMDKLKRTVDILKAFSQVQSNKMRLVLIGSMTKDVREETAPLIKADSRVTFVGWKTADELMEYLCAADVYVQPGGQSATMQNAICCGCTMMLYPYKSHEPYLQGNGFYIKTIEDMKSVFQEIVNDPSVLKKMNETSMKIAGEILNYKKLAARLYM